MPSSSPLPSHERRLGRRLLAATVVACSGVLLATGALQSSLVAAASPAASDPLLPLSFSVAGALAIAAILLGFVGRWITHHLEMTRAFAEELDRRAAVDADRVRLFSANERNRALLQAIIDHSAASISVKALDGRYLLANRRTAERHRRSVAEFVGKTDYDLFPPELAAAMRRFDQRVIAAGVAMQEEETMPLADGVHTLLSAKAPLVDDKGVIYAVCGIHTDITERKRAEEQLRDYRERLEELVEQRTAELQRANVELQSTNRRLEQAQLQLVQSEKMASIGLLAAGVAHEINNPIGFVGSNLVTLSQYACDLLRLVAAYEQADPALQQAAPARHAAIARMKRDIGLAALRDDVAPLAHETDEGLARVKKIVQDLREFSHVGSAEWQLADLHRGLDSTLNIACNELKHKVDVVRRYGELPAIECLPSELNQVFLNLFVNAAQAVDDRGELRVSTGVDGDCVWIEVADTGRGIAPDNLPRIFEPFFTTKPVGEGTGLGLALSYAIVKKHRGRVDVASTVGEGTRFRITLPRRQRGGD